MSKRQEITDYLTHPRPVLAWSILLISILFNSYTWALQNASSIIGESFIDLYDLNPSLMTYALGAFFYVYLVMQIPLGILIDRFGPRNIPTLAILVCSLGVLCFSQADTLTVVAFSRFLMGLGGSFAFLVGIKLISNWFYSKRFAYIFGIYVGVSAFGIIVMQKMVLHLVHVISWEHTFFLSGLFGALIACLYFFIVKEEPGGSLRIHVGQQEGNFRYFLREAFCNTQNWINGLTIGFVIGPFLAFMSFWSRPFLRSSYQFTETVAILMNVFAIIGYAIGLPFFARISTSIEKRKIFITWGTGFAFLMFLIIIYPPYFGPQLLGLCYFLLGFSISTVYLSYAIVHELNVPRICTTSLGIANTFFSAFFALSQLLIVLFYEMGLATRHESLYVVKNFEISLLRIPIYLFIGLIISFFIKESHARQTYTYR